MQEVLPRDVLMSVRKVSDVCQNISWQNFAQQINKATQGKRIKFVAFSVVHASRCCIYGLQRLVVFAGESLFDDMLAFVSSIADNCQQDCRRLSATLLTNVKRSLYLTFARKVLALFCRLTWLYTDGASLLWPWPFACLPCKATVGHQAHSCTIGHRPACMPNWQADIRYQCKQT